MTLSSAIGLIAGPERPPWMLPMIGLRVLTSIAMPHHGVDDGQAVAAGLDAAARVLADVGLVRGQLRDQRLLRDRATGLDHARDMSGELPNCTPPSLMFGHEMFSSIASIGEVVEATRDGDVVLDRRAAHVREEQRLAEVERRQDVVDHVIDAGILEPDRVQHARGRLEDAVRRITEARLARRALEHDRAGITVRETADPRVLLAEADAAGKQHDR
jgi:hypothetical protein